MTLSSIFCELSSSLVYTAEASQRRADALPLIFIPVSLAIQRRSVAHEFNSNLFEQDALVEKAVASFVYELLDPGEQPLRNFYFALTNEKIILYRY